MVGLGKMGGQMTSRIKESGIEVVGFDPQPGLGDVESLTDLVLALDAPRIVWLMVPAGDPTRSTVAELAEILSPGDLVIEGGNSRYTDDALNAELLAGKGISYVDCGVSGGVWGLRNGYGLMCGGAAEDIARAMPIFDALRPAGERADSFIHAGRVGAGHFAKMVHNGVEYGLMHAYGEGYELLQAQPLIDDVAGTLRAWTQGTVVRSWLLDLLVKALDEDPGLTEISSYTEDSGEGRWTVEEAVNLAVPAHVISAALFARFASRQEGGSPALKAVSALRSQFGGHSVAPAR